MDTTLMLLKPDALKRNLISEILSRIEHLDEVNIIGMKYIPNADPAIAAAHYAQHADKDFFPWLIKQITNDPIIAVALKGPHIIERMRKLAGDTDPEEAYVKNPTSIRGKFANDSLRKSREEGRAVRNLIHTAEDKPAAIRELFFWFKTEELS